MASHGKLYIIAAPSGGGKTSLIKAVLNDVPDIVMSVSHTTRDRRENEKEGVDYYFTTKEKFRALIGESCFLEHALVFGQYYGTSEKWVAETLASGKDVILEIDYQGAQQVRTFMPQAVSIFILPPSREVLEERLRTRNSDSEASIQARLDESIHEMSHYNEYNYLIINDDFDRALIDLKHIIAVGRLSVAAQESKHARLIQALLA